MRLRLAALRKVELQRLLTVRDTQMDDTNFHQTLLSSDNFAQCSLRATFFVRNLRGLRLWEVIREVHALLNVSEGFAWKDRDKWGIESDAWEFIERRGINPLLIFCHPRVISEQPRLLLYYRTATMLSQKGLRSMIGGDIARAESGKCERLEPAWINKLVIALNSIASAIIASSADIEADQLPGFQFHRCAA